MKVYEEKDRKILAIAIVCTIVMVIILVTAGINHLRTSEMEEEAVEYICYTPPVNSEDTYVAYYTPSDVELMAKVAYSESRGINSPLEISCIMWTILNRFDTGEYGSTIEEVITKPHQFAYSYENPMYTDHGIDLYAIASDVLRIWNDEKNGIDVSGRTLPKEYLWYGGDGNHNYFRNSFDFNGDIWDYSYPNPYTY